MKLEGTDFKIKVWKEINKIPKGCVKTYKEIAHLIGKPKSSRAVANACGKKPSERITLWHGINGT